MTPSANSKANVEEDAASAAASWWRSPSTVARAVTSATGLAEGYDLGSIGGALVLVTQDIPLTPPQVGWIVSIFYFTMAAGAPLGGLLSDLWGRKLALAVTYVLLGVGSLCMSFATNFYGLLAGRFIMGAGVGSGYCVVTTYMTEVSTKNHRGCYVCMEDLFIVVGISLGYGVSSICASQVNGWRYIFLVGVLPVLVAAMLLMLPHLLESPRWNMLQGRRDLAVKDLTSLVGEEEAFKMLEQWEDGDEKVASWSDVLRPASSDRRRALLAGCGSLIAAMLTGINVIIPYIGDLLDHDLAKPDAMRCATIISCMRLMLLILVVFFVVDRVGRRTLMLVSLFGCSVACAMLAICYEFEARVSLKLAAFLLFGCSFSAGMGPIPFVYCTEIFPSNARSKSVGFGMCLARIVGGVLSLAFPIAKVTFGLWTCFWVLAMLNGFAMMVIYLWAPETIGTSLEEMQTLVFKKTPRPLEAAKA
eukprot:TRINITY_DN63613_c0_g1_i1.p1 TRINITY_DN63613_c0_g1~~TRINITY_DN63613_c0_g1_i1.p1  ORF type:complete len:475 (+),score=68.70 TRINITY_DN63613_c0_g1_i1:137-1561(+)